MRIALVGMGMGDPGLLTGEARQALIAAAVVIGASRLLERIPDEFSGERIALAAPDEVAAVLRAHPEWRKVCVALSGDVGFYSGARRLLHLLPGFEIRLVPGISSPQYFAARLHRPWQDFRLVSGHGERCDVLSEVLNHPAVLFLTGSGVSAEEIISILCEAGLPDARVSVGESLASPNERVISGTAGEMSGCEFSPLNVVLVENERTFARDLCSPGIADDDFVRGATPMTKREVRAVALALLGPGRDSVLYDVGAGTGSVAVEMALQARRGRVYAFERDEVACRLIESNRAAFGAYNLRLVQGAAPEAMADCPAPDAAFIGGSGGRLEAIVDALLAKNRKARLVIAAITLETLSSALECLQRAAVRNIEACQLAANRTVVRGGYHMLQALNPVFLVSGGGSLGE